MILARMAVVVILCFGSASYAGSAVSGLGFQVGLGIPFLSQRGIHYKASDKFGFSLAYNYLSFEVDNITTKLTMPEFLIHYHPFSGSYFIAVGVGQETLDVSTLDSYNGSLVSINVTATTGVAKTGWMWGFSKPGFWFGIDVSYIVPSNGKTTIEAPGVDPSSQSYTDAVTAADKFGKTAYSNITMARLGWMF